MYSLLFFPATPLYQLEIPYSNRANHYLGLADGPAARLLSPATALAGGAARASGAGTEAGAAVGGAAGGLGEGGADPRVHRSPGKSWTRSWTSTWHRALTPRLHSTRIWTRTWRRPSELIIGVSDQEEVSV